MRLVLAATIALGVAACGTAPLPTAPTAVPAVLGDDPGLSLGTLSRDPKASCPDGHYPERFRAEIHHGETMATFVWAEVLGDPEYQIEIDRYDVTNVFLRAGNMATTALTVDWRIESEGRYRARIRTRVCGSQFGPWSPYLFFSADQGPPTGRDDPNSGESFYALGSNIESFALLAGAAITCTTSTVAGNVGVSPGSSITGFPGLCTVSGGGLKTPAESAAAQADLAGIEADIQAKPCTPLAALLDGVTVGPGTYCVGAGVTNLTSSLTLSGAGSYTFKLPSTLITSPGAQMHLTHGASCGGVVWQVGSSATLTGTIVGNVIAAASITINPGTIIVGRALARTGAVTMTTATITKAGCS